MIKQRTIAAGIAATAITAAGGLWATGADASGFRAEAVLLDPTGAELGTVEFEGADDHTSVRLKLRSVPTGARPGPTRPAVPGGGGGEGGAGAGSPSRGG